MANYFIIAGETSGDIHAAALIKQIRLRDPDAVFEGFGGDQMAAAGCLIHQHIRYMAFMAIAAVLANAGQVLRNFRIAQRALMAQKPDVLILIDYPTFNLKMASFCRKHLPDTKIVYYIPPKIWAWKKWRVHKIARLCDEILGIFPFEPAFYARYGYKCTYVGNPTAERINSVLNAHQSTGDKRHEIALLPGSRRSEITNCLPRMLEAARAFPDYHIVVTAAPGIEDEFYTPYLRAHETLTRDTYGAVLRAAAAVVNCGTATLETALLRCPQVIVYHLACNWFFVLNRRWMQPLIFSIPYFSLVNIIADREVVKECISTDFTITNVRTELERLLHNETHRKELLASYEQLSSILGTRPAAERAAEIITSI